MERKRRTRGNGEGSVYLERSTRNGRIRERWVAKVIVAGRTHRTFAATEAKAKTELRRLLAKVDAGLPVGDGGMTVQHLLDDWAAKALPNRNLEPSTVARHRESIKVLVAELGTRRLRSLTPEDVEAALTRRAVTAGYSKASCQKLRTTLGLALAWAERRGHVARNVARVVELPSAARPAKPGKTMTVDEARRFLAAVEGSSLAAMWTVMVYLGLRPGEAAGLAWEDIDITGGIVHVRRGRKLDATGRAFIGAPKTSQSVRSLDAPPAVIQALRAHRQAQNRQRLAMGELWANPDDLVFTSATGAASDPSRVRREFAAVVAAADIGTGWTSNLLRHTAASLMADAGVPIEEVADQLGHRDTRMASLHYRHRIRPTVAGGTVLADVLSSP